MPTSFKNSFINGTDIDSDELRIRPNALRFLKNLLWNVNRNSQASSTEGKNAGVLTPLESTVHLTSNLTMGAGLNYCCGYKESRDTNEGFVFIYNTRGNHMIYSVSGKDGSVQIVYRNANLKFKYNPENFINESRCVVRVFTYVDPATGLETKRTFILYTDATNTQRLICKEDSINTSWFLSSFFMPKATPSGEILAAREQYINLGVQPPMGCVAIETIEPDDNDILKQNLLVDKGWQFRIKYIDIYGRESEHGTISERFFLVTGNSCIANSSGLPRCLNLTFNAGNPFVNKIQIEYRTCTSNVADLSVDSGWQLYDVIDKYESSTAPWYTKAINPLLNYTSLQNSIRYVFCADKLSVGIAAAETNRLYNPLPLTSDSLFALNKGIGVANNVRDFEPVSKGLLDKISFSVVAPTVGVCEDLKPRTIVAYALIWNPYDNQNSRVRYNSEKDLYYFYDEGGADLHGLDHGQIFPQGIVNFTFYLAGTNYVTIGKQVVLYTDDNTVGPLGSLQTSRPYLVVQEATFVGVVPGKYNLRIASHSVKPNENYQNTSTFTAGITVTNPANTNPGKLNSVIKEKVIDVCDADYRDPVNLLVIYDTVANDIGTLSGYLYESELEKIPVELQIYSYVVQTGTPILSTFTDHNGFFFIAGSKTAGTITYSLNILVNDCVTSHNVVYNQQGGDDIYYETRDLFVFHQQDKFPNIGRRYYRGRIHQCDKPLIGIPGIPVVLSNGQWVKTDNNGRWTIVAHQRSARTNGANGVSTDWTVINDRIIVSQGGVCQILSCTGCEMCFPDYYNGYVACTGSVRDVDFGTLEASIRGANQAGPQNGGRYGLGVTFHDWMGRCDFVQATDDYFVDIPSLLQLKSYAFSKIAFAIATPFVAPAWAKYMSFWITSNLNWQDSLTWAIDRVAFVDSAGVENAPNPIKIRIYYESIIEYASQNNFSTNASWQFLDTNGNPTLGDRLEFLQKPNGEWYEKTISALARYDKEGKYIEIDYDEDLKDLQDGTLIKLVRPKKTEENNLFFELCPIIRLDQGVPQVFSGEFNYVDSYFMTRSIPVPFYTTSVNTDGVPIVTRNVIAKTYTYNYEHPSPSDFWGDHCRTRGRVNVKNPYERQKRIGSEIALSKALINKSNFNGLSYFDEADVEVFNEHEWGNITAVLPENNTVLVLCERDNFVTGFNDTIVRTGPAGQVVASSIPDKFGPPQRKLGSNYGCRKRDINTIQKRNGIVVFLDSNKSELVFHTFGDATDISKMTLTKAWVEPAVKTVKVILNDVNNKFSPYFVGGVDPKNNEYYLTKFGAFRDPVAIDNDPESILVLQYINQLPDINLQANETLVYSLEKGNIMFKGFVSPTPEYYGTLEGYYLDSNMLMMKQATAHSTHNAAQGGTYNNFFGTQCKKVIVVVANAEPEEVKRFLWTEVFCKEHVFTADKVRTEAGQMSRIKLGYWQKADNFYTAPYLCDLNTLQDTFIPVATGVNKLLDGDVMYGRWIETRYVSEAADDAKYCEVSAIEIHYVDTKQKSE